MRIAYENDTERGCGLFRCTNDNFPAGPVQISVERATDRLFLKSGGWTREPTLLPVDARPEAGGLTLLLGPDIVDHLEAQQTYRVGVRAHDGSVVTGVVTPRSVLYGSVPEAPPPDEESAPPVPRRRGEVHVGMAPAAPDPQPRRQGEVHVGTAPETAGAPPLSDTSTPARDAPADDTPLVDNPTVPDDTPADDAPVFDNPTVPEDTLAGDDPLVVEPPVVQTGPEPVKEPAVTQAGPETETKDEPESKKRRGCGRLFWLVLLLLLLLLLLWSISQGDFSMASWRHLFTSGTTQPKPGGALVIPDKPKDVSFLEGRWICESGLVNDREEKIVYEFSFDGAGAGQATVHEQGGGRCAGAAGGSLTGDGLHIDVDRQVCAARNGAYHAESIDCENRGRVAECRSKQTSGKTWSCAFIRAE